jgi:hypothetical protein
MEGSTEYVITVHMNEGRGLFLHPVQRAGHGQNAEKNKQACGPEPSHEYPLTRRT